MGISSNKVTGTIAKVVDLSHNISKKEVTLVVAYNKAEAASNLANKKTEIEQKQAGAKNTIKLFKNELHEIQKSIAFKDKASDYWDK